MNIPKPNPEHIPSYYQTYTSKVEGNDLLQCLGQGEMTTYKLFAELPAAMADFRYSPNKWSVKEMLLHLIDSERVFLYRALRFSRLDPTPLPGFEQDDYVVPSGAGERSMDSLLEEYQTSRQSSLAFFASLTPKQWEFMGTASEVSMSAASIGFIICGHEIHHSKVLLERYVPLWNEANQSK